MKRIAVIFEGGLDNLTGLTNAVLARVKYLRKASDFVVDVYDVLSYPFGVTRLIFSPSKYDRMDTVIVDGIEINILWHRRIMVDDIMNFKLHIKPLFSDAFLQSQVERFKGYDLISAHAFVGAKQAEFVHHRYGTPFCVTWHGSEIHSIPPSNRYQRLMTKQIIEAASCNFFVSQNLMQAAKSITKGGKAIVLYNGVNPIFKRYIDVERQSLREKNGVVGVRVIAFVGNLKPVKNVRSLPQIFKAVAQRMSQPIQFWIIGAGEERKALEVAFTSTSLNVRFWGHQPTEKMPELMNCMDVLVLPSHNEGLPLVLAEAISCGSNAVGSRVGGIPEVIGDENTIPLGDGFTEKMAQRIVHFLMHEEPQFISPDFSWEGTAKKEMEIYTSVLSNKSNQS